MQTPMIITDYPLLRFKHESFGDQNVIQDTQVLSLRYGKLIDDDHHEEIWLLKVFFLKKSIEIEIPISEIIPEPC
jgi:hypothetical protein